MKTARLLLLTLLVTTVMFAQNPPNGVTPDCSPRSSLKEDVKRMYAFLNDLDRMYVQQMMTLYYVDSNRVSGKPTNPLIERQQPTISAIFRDIKEIEQMFPCLKLNPESSCLCYHLNKEINDYIGSLNLFADATRLVITPPNGSMNAFYNSEFVKAFHYMSSSRASLMAAMDNLQRHQELVEINLEMKKAVIDSIASARDDIKGTVKKETRKWGLIVIFGVLVTAILASQ
jgi:hypothetical protein